LYMNLLTGQNKFMDMLNKNEFIQNNTIN